MNTGDYRFAELRPDEVKELREAERSLSAKAGHPITLIAFHGADETSGGSPSQAKTP